jgi:hypothetical protein
MKNQLALFLAIASLAFAPGARSDNITHWAGPSGGLWGDPANWTGGVPTSQNAADISYPFYTPDLFMIDLGGGQRSVSILELESPYLRLINGSLVVDTIIAQGGYDTLNPANTLAIPITSTTATLSLNGGVRSVLHIDAPISGTNLAVQSTYVSFGAANTYTGPTITLPFSPTYLAGQGSALASSAYELGGTLTLDNSGTNLSNRLNDAAPVRFTGGTLRIIGNSTAEVSERVGMLDFSSGSIEMPALPAMPVTLHAAGLQHDIGGSGYINLNAAAGNRILLDTVPQLVGGGPGAPLTARGTIPWLFSGLPCTYDAGDPGHPEDATGLRPLDRATELASSIPASPGNFLYNVSLTTNQTQSADVGVNYFAITGATLTLDNATVTVNGNWLDVSSATITGNGALRFPGDATIIGDANIDVPIQAHSLTLASDGYINLSKPNDLPGGIDLGYQTTISLPQALGAGKVHIQNGARVVFAIGSAELTNDIAFGDLLPTPSPIPGGYVLQIIRLAAGDPSIPVVFKGNLSGGELVINLNGSFRLDGNAAFDSLLIGANGLNRLELNGTLGPDRTTPDFIEFRGNLSGNGKLLGIFDAGTIDPGSVGKPGRLTIQQVAAGNLAIDLTGPEAGIDYDQLIVMEAILKPLQLEVRIGTGFTPLPAEVFLILDNQGNALSPAFADLPEGGIFASGNTSFQVSYTAGDGNDISLTVVPEPAAIFFAAPLLLLFRRRSRR